MSNYNKIEEAAAKVLRNVEWDERPERPLQDTVAQGHYRFIHNPNGMSITLTPGSVNRTFGTLQTMENEWTVNAQLYMVQNRDKSEEFYTRIRKIRDAILTQLDVYPTLNTQPGDEVNVTRAYVSNMGEPEWLQIARTYLWTQEISISVREVSILPDRGEYARWSM